jgi:hypothetical protein
LIDRSGEPGGIIHDPPATGYSMVTQQNCLLESMPTRA